MRRPGEAMTPKQVCRLGFSQLNAKADRVASYEYVTRSEYLELAGQDGTSPSIIIINHS